MPSRGFSLLELLVVLVLMGILAGGAVLALRDRQAAALNAETQRLVNALTLQRDTLLISGAGPTALSLKTHSYAWLVPSLKAAEPWQLAAKVHALPSFMRLELVLNGHARTLPEQRWPAHIVLGGSGEITPARIRLHLPERGISREIQIGFAGSIEVHDAH